MVSRTLYQNTFAPVSKVPINPTTVTHGKLYLQIPATFEPSLYFCQWKMLRVHQLPSFVAIRLKRKKYDIKARKIRIININVI